jgi:hypothetical protein
MKGSDVRKWIEAGFKDYGKDPWFFIRELAQNSRDAGAKTIRVKAGRTTKNNEILIFEDDGHGMTYAHAARYLFCLYASSKTNEKYSAGIFGIGFWTVLKFNPSKIIIESCFKGEKWGVLVDADLNTTPTACDLTESGTRITLVRPPMEKTVGEFVKKTEQALVRYCSYLRRNTRNAPPLPVLFSGKNITRKMNLPGPVRLRFNEGLVEGVVGLAPRPQVRLFARGLPVWQGTTLDELSHTPGSQSSQQEMAKGLAPVFLLNGNNLEVNISRRKVIDNRALQKARKIAENALSHLVEIAAESVSPRSLLQRFSYGFKKAAASILRSFWKTLLVSVLLILPLEYILLTTFYKKSSGPEKIPMLSMRVENNRYSGASVGAISARGTVEISYHPPATTWFKLYHAEEYQQASGFIQTFTRSQHIPFPPVNCAQKAITIELTTPEKGTLLLPQPVAHSLDPGSMTLDGLSLYSVDNRSTVGAVITIPHSGVIRYQCCPEPERDSLSMSMVERLTQLPQHLSMPASIQKVLSDSMELSTGKKVEIALGITISLLKYDDSAEIAEKYRNSLDSDWLQKVLGIGAGDCDILNGVTILFLRRMGVPARLAIGLIGENGKILPGMHAWTEYFDGRWRYLDSAIYTPSTRETGTTSPIPHTFQRYPEAAYKLDQPIDMEAIKALPFKKNEMFENREKQRVSVTRRRSFYPLLLFAIFFIFALLILLLILTRRKRPDRPFKAEDMPRVKDNLAGMALHALLHPRAWGENTNIRNVKIIPTITGAPLSLHQALKLSKTGRLFYISQTNPLVRHLEKASVPILKTGHPAFDPLIKLLPGGINLDRITALRAVVPEKADNSLMGQLLSGVSRLLSLPCLVAPGLLTEDFFDVDLTPLPSLSGSVIGIPSQFIAVNPGSNQIQSILSLFKENPQLAQFKLVNILLKESGLFPTSHHLILEKVSRHLLKEIS